MTIFIISPSISFSRVFMDILNCADFCTNSCTILPVIPSHLEKKKWWFTPTFCCLPFGWVFYPIRKFYPITAKPFKSLLRVWWSLLLKSLLEIRLSLSRCGHLAPPNIPKDLWGRHDISLWKIMLYLAYHTYSHSTHSCLHYSFHQFVQHMHWPYWFAIIQVLVRNI